MREERLREEQLLLKEQKRKEEQDAQKERQKEQERLLRTREAMEENQRQLESKRKAVEEERTAGLMLREKFKNDVDAFKRAVVDERKEDKAKRMQYRESLQRQAEELAKVDRNLSGITEKEKELNKGILHKVGEDPHMMSRVLHRVRLGK
jgi:hypothetical protein